jgi:hypothetical protein
VPREGIDGLAGLGGRLAQEYAQAVAGYAANARLQGAAPQLVLAGTHGQSGFATIVPESSQPGVTGAVDQFELVGRPIDETIADWLASVGESFSQLTFFLFDPESWR